MEIDVDVGTKKVVVVVKTMEQRERQMRQR